MPAGSVVDPYVEASQPARFRPTRRQALGRGMYLGALSSVTGVTASVVTTITWPTAAPPGWLWMVLGFGPAPLGALGGVLARRWFGTVVDADGIRTGPGFARGVEPWSRVVDLRAERRGARTVVSVYLDSGVSMQLAAPYSGELFAADPQFELKVFALSHLWRSHRFGGVPT